MKIFRKILLIMSFLFVILSNTSCVAKVFEKEINVVFMYEDEFISSDTVTQFKNIKSPELSSAYIPDGYKFFGWTPYDPNSVKATDENFKEKYVGAGKMVHWADIADHVKGETVILRSLMIDKNEIPKEYHYVVIAWYDKLSTSGLDENIIARFEDSLFAYLRSINVSEEDLATIVIRGYTGNVGPTCGQIMEDDDVDIMLGWGSADNVTTTGGMDPAMLLETVSGFAVGAKNRTLHRLTESESVLTVMEWLKSDECRAIFA